MRTLKRSLQILVVTALLALPVAAVSAQSGTVGNGYVWDGASDWPGVTSAIVAPEELPQTGASSFDSYTMDDRALLAVEPWSGPDLSSMTQTEPGDIWVAANPTTSEPAPSALPETGSNKIPEPAIKNWRFDGFTLVPDWAATAQPEAINDVASEPPLALPVTGSAQQPGTATGGFVWDGTTYVPDVVSEPPLALPATGSGGASSSLNGAYNEEFTSPADLAPLSPLSPPLGLPATGNSGVRSSLNGAYNEEFTQPSDVGAPGPYVGLPVTGVNPND